MAWGPCTASPGAGLGNPPIVTVDRQRGVDPLGEAAAVRLAGDRLAHFHACGSDRGTPGADHIAWPGIAAALAETGYAGPVVIESFTPENQSIARAAAIWRPLAASQDALAVEGLAFLRTIFG